MEANVSGRIIYCPIQTISKSIKMKKLIFLPFLILLITASCNNSANSGDGSGKTDSNSKALSTTSGAGKGTITCFMDGVQKTFNVQQSFFEIPLGVDPNGPKDGLEILDGDAKKEGFQFEFKKSGTTKIKSDATGDMNCIINYYNPEGVVYTGDDVTINITSYSQSNLTGTFSGKLANINYDGGLGGAKAKIAKNYPQYIQITDGKFDLNTTKQSN